MNRIDKLFRKKGGNILSVFFTAGFPDLDSTTSIIKGLEQAGADMVEIGIPFSDPVADGPVIQASSEKALRNGMSLHVLFDQLAGIREKVSLPLLMMGYLNPVLKFGIEDFCTCCARIGIDGVILPDLPPDVYAEKYSGGFSENGIYNIFLITPQSSPDRIKMIDSISRGFIYLVSSNSTTGARRDFTEENISYFRRIREMKLRNPWLTGFGIADEKSFKVACGNSNGAIIGSAFVSMLAETGGSGEDIKKFVQEILIEKVQDID